MQWRHYFNHVAKRCDKTMSYSKSLSVCLPELLKPGLRHANLPRGGGMPVWIVLANAHLLAFGGIEDKGNWFTAALIAYVC